MISTTQSPNGFKSELMPMAFSSRDQSAKALCNAMLAVAAYHHNGSEAALHYKAVAVRSLFDSLRLGSESPSPDPENLPQTIKGDDIIDTQIAASMMLCVYSVSGSSQKLSRGGTSFCANVSHRFLMNQREIGIYTLMAQDICCRS